MEVTKPNGGIVIDDEEYQTFRRNQMKRIAAYCVLGITPFIILAILALLNTIVPQNLAVILAVILIPIVISIGSCLLAISTETALNSVKTGMRMLSTVQKPILDTQRKLVYLFIDDITVMAYNGNIYFLAFKGISQVAERPTLKIPKYFGLGVEMVTIEGFTLCRKEDKVCIPGDDGKFYEGQALMYVDEIAQSKIMRTFSKVRLPAPPEYSKDQILAIAEHLKNDVKYGLKDEEGNHN